MSPIPSSTSPGTSEAERQPKVTLGKRTQIVQTLMVALIILGVFVAWQVLSALNNSTDPMIAGRPLSNPHTHLHTIALGKRPGVFYLGTHYGLFTSTDRGQTWPQPHGALNNYMVTAIAVSPSNPSVLALIVIPTSGLGQRSGIAISHDGGSTWQISAPTGLSSSAYPYTVKAGSGNFGQFYAFYFFTGWFETRDMGSHWYPITKGTLSNMQTPSLLTDPTNPNHLYLGGDQGFYESHDDGNQWLHISAIEGNIQSMIATDTTPRVIYCVTDQSFYHWSEGSKQITHITHLPMQVLPTRLATDTTGKALYGLSGQDLWFSQDSGTTWIHRWHFDRGDLISLVVDPLNPRTLYAGFFLPPKVVYSTNGGNSWQTLTD